MSQSRFIRPLASLCCGVLALASAGCQTYQPYGYGYGGGYSYPMYGQPGQPGQVMPYSGPWTIQGAPGAPLMQQPNGFPPPAYPPAAYPPGAGAPPFGQTGTLPPNPNVPTQGVDNSGGNDLGTPGQFPGATGTRPNMPPEETDYLNQTAPSANKRPAPTPGVADEADFNSKDGAQRANQKLTEDEPPIPAKTTMLNDEFNGSFTPPVVTRSARSNIVQTVQHEEATQNPDLRPYGRAKNGRDWFRGVIDFDKQENTWYMIYNPTAELSDQLGGMITLVDHPHLQHFTADDLALVEGAFDPSELDANGNPKYRITTIRRLEAP